MADTKRLFFALWPDDESRLALSRVFLSSAYAKADGQLFNFMNLHLTLHFLGSISEDKYSCFLEAAEDVKFDAFNLSLDQFGIFEKAKIFWLGMSDVPAGLIQLHNGLGQALSACDYKSEDRVFTPHVTLMRKIKPLIIEEQPQRVSWSVNKFALVESVTVKGSVLYKPVKFYSA